MKSYQGGQVSYASEPVSELIKGKVDYSSVSSACSGCAAREDDIG